MDENTVVKYRDHLHSIIQKYRANFNIHNRGIESDIAHGIIARASKLVPIITGPRSEYTKRIKYILEVDGHPSFHAGQIVDVLSALYDELRLGYLTESEGLMYADLFGDFLSQAEYLVNNKFKDAAAVMAGGVLESHLRKLATDNAIELHKKGREGEQIPKKTSELNHELKKKNIYGQFDCKQIDAWLDLRNNAAHGHYLKFDLAQVELFISWLREFIHRNHSGISINQESHAST